MLAGLIVLSVLGVDCARAQLLANTITQWFWGSALATDTHLYITDGEYWETLDGVSTSYHQNSTLIVDLTTSWSNQTITAIAVANPMINVRQPMLFYDKQRNKISRYGGWAYDQFAGTNFPSQLWSFTPSTNSAKWKNETAPSIDGLTADSPGPIGSANAYTNTTYYNLGGNVVPDMSLLPAMTVMSGLVTRDLVAQDWSNATTDIPKQNQRRTQARMVVAPNFGDSGYLVVIGGEAPPKAASIYEGGTYMVDMATITLYDIKSKQWYTQTATGDIPPPRSEFCAVGSPSTGGKRFELFVYGGSTNNTNDLNHPDDEGYLNVYALSLPAFRWFKSNSSTPVRRACHACSIIGKSQMISIGGRLPSSLQSLGAEQDPWSSGLGIFDMTAFEWADHFNAAADTYQSPEVVKQYYNGSYQPPAFSDATLAKVFAFKAPAGSNSTTPGSPSSSSNTGAIAGGVIGGVVLLAFFGVLIWWWQRRKRQQKVAGKLGPDRPHDSKYVDGSYDHDISYEAASNPRYEVDATSSSHSGLGMRPGYVAELPAESTPLTGGNGFGQRR